MVCLQWPTIQSLMMKEIFSINFLRSNQKKLKLAKKHRKLRSRHPNFNDNMGIKSYPDKNTTFSNAYGIDLNEKQTIKDTLML